MVFVRTLTGMEFEFDIKPDLVLVKGLKAMIQDTECIPPDQQRLLFEGKQLCDSYSLSDYGVKTDSIIHIVLRLRGGGVAMNRSFEPSEENRKLSKFDDDAPDYRTVIAGLNLSFECKSCNENVIVPIGFSDQKWSRISELTAGKMCTNIACKKKLKPSDYDLMYMYNCKYEYEGSREKGKCEGKGECSESNGATYFSGEGSGEEKLTWEYLKIKVTKRLLIKRRQKK